MFLTQEQLQELTERVRPTAQIKWLKEHGYPFDVGAEGNPKVLASVVESRLGGTVTRRPRLRIPKDAAA